MCVALLVLGMWLHAGAQTKADALREALGRIAEPAQAVVGAAVLFEEADEERLVTIGGETAFPLLSVFKFHVAVAALDRMEREGIAPRQTVRIAAERLHEGTYSPLRDANPGRDACVSYEELIRYAVSLSDNHACDVLIDFAGGIDPVDAVLRRTGIGGFELTQTEETMHADPENCYCNRSTPSAMVRLMKAVCGGRVLGPSQTGLLMRAMAGTSTGPDKLRAGLPDSVRLGHKTGSSDRLANGLKIADNDAGFFRLPDGTMCYMAVFVMDSAESDAENARLIARMARAVYGLLCRTDE